MPNNATALKPVHASAAHRGHVVYRLPAPRVALPRTPDERVIHEARLADSGIDLRVGWDGSEADPGRFEVLTEAGTWAACPHTDASDAINDLMHTTADIGNKPFLVRVQRDAGDGGSGFAVKVLPVVGLGDLSDRPSDSVAVRGRDYAYAEGVEPARIDWIASVEDQGVQSATVTLTPGRDYELWVRLSAPGAGTGWRVLDPIVRSGSAGGGQIPPT